MSVRSKKAGSHFGTVNQSGKITPEAAAALMLLAGFPPKPKVIAEGLGTIEAESGFDPKNPGDGTHIGLWQEEPSYGSREDRLDAFKSTVAAYKNWKANGESFNQGWTKWEHGEAGGTGVERAPKYMKLAESVIKSGGGSIPQGGGINPLEPAEAAIEGVESAEQFLVKMGETLLDFKALGNLAAHALAWLIRLIAKAIWDYVIAPLIHWSERAVSFYWIDFFGTGTEQGSGLGYQLRNNAGAITIFFWSMGYAILWSDGTSATPVAASDSLLGQGVKGIEGAIARRNLVKPKDVKKKTPSKPEPVVTKVPIEHKQTFSVGRKRPVSVAKTRSQEQSGRMPNGSSKGFEPKPVPRPGQAERERETQKIILPPNVKQRREQTHTPTAKPGRSRVGT